jgi:hypothetical protein
MRLVSTGGGRWGFQQGEHANRSWLILAIFTLPIDNHCKRDLVGGYVARNFDKELIIDINNMIKQSMGGSGYPTG